MMKIIEKFDRVWHPMGVEMPARTVDVDLKKKDGTIIDSEIYVDISGHFIYHDGNWHNSDEYTHWRFKDTVCNRRKFRGSTDMAPDKIYASFINDGMVMAGCSINPFINSSEYIRKDALLELAKERYKAIENNNQLSDIFKQGALYELHRVILKIESL